MNGRSSGQSIFGGSMDMVLPALYLGGTAAEADYEELKRRGITHVLQVGEGLCPSHPGSFTYLTHACRDDPFVQLSGLFCSAFAFIDQGVASGGVLVHCFAGVSRSATICTGYIMWKQQRTRDEALHIVQAARPTAQPNWGFMEQLQAFQERQWQLPLEDDGCVQATPSPRGTVHSPGCTATAEQGPPAACTMSTALTLHAHALPAHAAASDLLPV